MLSVEPFQYLLFCEEKLSLQRSHLQIEEMTPPSVRHIKHNDLFTLCVLCFLFVKLKVNKYLSNIVLYTPVAHF